jgi:hypothetical protein
MLSAIEMRPALLFALIWLGWLISWMVAALWSNRTEKRLVKLGGPRLPNSHCCWCNSVVAFDRPARGSRTNLARGIYGRVPPRRSNPGGDPIRLVGANSSRTSLVLGSDPQAKPSRSRQRSVRSRSSSDLHRAVGLRSRDDDRPGNTNCPGRLDTGRSGGLDKGTRRGTFPRGRTRTERLRVLSAPCADAAALRVTQSWGSPGMALKLATPTRRNSTTVRPTPYNFGRPDDQ